MIPYWKYGTVLKTPASQFLSQFSTTRGGNNDGSM